MVKTRFDQSEANGFEGFSLKVRHWVIAVSAIVMLLGLYLSIYIVSEGERGVLTRNGAFVTVKEPGLGFKLPLFDSITKMEVRNMALEIPVHVYSLDTQQYEALVTINYDLESAQVEMIFKKEGIYYADRRLKPLAETTMKEVAGKFNAQRTIQERDAFGIEVRTAIRDGAKVYGINVTEVQVKNIDFTDQFERAIEQAMLAKAKVEEERSILEQKRITAETVVVTATAQANATRECAKGEADAKVTQAQAEATRILQIGLAEAEAIQKKSGALRNNPELTNYTYALAAMKWDGALPKQFVPGSAMPLINVGSSGGPFETSNKDIEKAPIVSP